MNITVYSKPDCVQCRATKRAFDDLDLPYEVVDVSVDEQARQRLAALGYLAVPVVICRSPAQQWSGYRPDRITRLATSVRRATA